MIPTLLFAACLGWLHHGGNWYYRANTDVVCVCERDGGFTAYVEEHIPDPRGRMFAARCEAKCRKSATAEPALRVLGAPAPVPQ